METTNVGASLHLGGYMGCCYLYLHSNNRTPAHGDLQSFADLRPSLLCPLALVVYIFFGGTWSAPSLFEEFSLTFLACLGT